MAETPGSTADKAQLRDHLWDACEIEHQLMIQYLFAAFTLKKRPDETCSPAEWEYVRRWGSQVFMVARQEMEHLALANGILTATSEDPFFARENIPVMPRYLLGGERERDHSPAMLRAGKASEDAPTPCDIPFKFERFNLDTISRFVCAESPSWDVLQENHMRVPRWCFSETDRPCGTTLADWESGRFTAGAGAMPLSRTHIRPAANAAAAAAGLSSPVHPGSIQALYEEIRRMLHAIPGVFTGKATQQVFVPVEYQISVTPVTDLASADLAIRQIVEEGEGIDEVVTFQSHFTRFFQVRDELEAITKANPRFDAALPVILDPTPDKISDPYTLRVYELFDHAYATMLFVLASLYRNFNSQESSYPFLSQTLQNIAFGPFMTMILRPIAEVLAHLKVAKDSRETAGPGFRLSPRDELILWPRPPARAPDASPGVSDDERRRLSKQLEDIEFFLRRMDHVVDELHALSTERLLKTHLRADGDEPYARRQLAFVFESAQAMANSLRRVYQIGELPQFVVTPNP